MQRFCVLLLALSLFSCQPEALSSTAAFENAQTAVSQGRTRDAFESFLYAAENSHFEAMVHVSYYYEDGYVVPRDLMKSDYWLEKAATPTATSPGNAHAQYILGLNSIEGLRTEVNYEQAYHWLSLSADQGDAFSIYEIGTLYEEGLGVEVDFVEALQWYEKAANMGNAMAQFNLGTSYHSGDITPKNEIEAKMWFERAAKQELPQAFSALANYYISEADDVMSSDTLCGVALLRKGMQLGDFKSTQMWQSILITNPEGELRSLDQLLPSIKLAFSVTDSIHQNSWNAECILSADYLKL